MTAPLDIRAALVAAGSRLYDRGMVAGTDGNLSVRLSDGNILMTPSGLPKGQLASDDLVVVAADGTHVEGRLTASSEAAMHLAVYRRRPEVKACVHSHAPHATAFAAAGIPLPENILPEVVLFVGGVPLTAYAPPGTEAVPRSLEPFWDDNDAFLLRNHGLLTIGDTLATALHRHETVEHYARIVLLARQLGPLATIPADDIERLTAMRRTSKGQSEKHS